MRQAQSIDTQIDTVATLPTRDILLICDLSSRARTAKFRRYAARLRDILQADVYICDYSDLSIDLAPGRFEIYDHANNRALDSYGCVMFRGAIPKLYVAAAISHYLHERGVAFLNDYRAYRSANKLLQAIEFYKLKLPFPRTIFCTDRIRLLELMNRCLAYPMIVKATKGSRGQNNYLLQAPADSRKFMKRPAKIGFMAQTYIPNNSDFRILVVGSEVAIRNRAGRANSHLNNLSRGATIQSVPVGTLPKRIITQARQLAAATNLKIAGIDVLADAETGKHYFLEINAQPGWGKLEADIRPLFERLLMRS